MKKNVKRLDRDEMRSIAEEVARDPEAYSSARMGALRFLKDLLDDSEGEAKSAFAELDELAPRRRRGS